ncbi:MAG: glutamate formimidoyltransferase [Bacillota bacterium]|jgi:glutamate formiminotransferase/formiminotetrahydrofolate cyclodeaminase
MAKDCLVECVPNFSEGRDQRIIEEIVRCIPESGCRLLDVQSDASHNRSVVTFIGQPDKVVEAAFACTKKASELINMELHSGQHPRMGATDVIPFVPVQGVSMDECIEMAKTVGRRIASELGIPVYLYGKAATRPDRVRLPDVRRGEYEGLKVAIGTDPERMPDFGPPRMHPTAGATAVGARPPLIAYNVNLDTGDIVKARTIARAIRESSGGLPAVQAKGILIKETGDVQVTMNLTDHKVTSIDAVMHHIETEAEKVGAKIKNSEIVGLLPLDALLDVAIARLRLTGFSRRQILDLVGQQAEGEEGPCHEEKRDSGSTTTQKECYYLAQMDLSKFVDDLAAPTGAPGGGAAAAVAGVLGCALVRMVAGNTLSKARFKEGRDRLEEIRKASQALIEKFQELAVKDAESYMAVEAAIKMPRVTEEEKAARRAAMQEAFKGATLAPLETVAEIIEAMSLLPDLTRYGNPNAITDMAVGALLLDAARRGAAMNVQVNLGSIDDEGFVAKAREDLSLATSKAQALLQYVIEGVKAQGLDF